MTPAEAISLIAMVVMFATIVWVLFGAGRSKRKHHAKDE